MSERNRKKSGEKKEEGKSKPSHPGRGSRCFPSHCAASTGSPRPREGSTPCGTSSGRSRCPSGSRGAPRSGRGRFSPSPPSSSPPPLPLCRGAFSGAPGGKKRRGSGRALPCPAAASASRGQRRRWSFAGESPSGRRQRAGLRPKQRQSRSRSRFRRSQRPRRAISRRRHPLLA